MATKDEIINLEIKARIPNITEKQKIVEAIGGKIMNSRQELDVYFHTNKGTSLKIKQVGDNASLLYYQFDAGKKISNFKTIENLNNADALTEILKEVLKVKSIISKKKIMYRYNDMSVNFSEIDGLGSFVEMQISTKNNKRDTDEAQDKLRELSKILKIKEEDIETHGYGDVVYKVNY